MAKTDRPQELYTRFKLYVQSQKLIMPGSKVLAAVSGGIDSAVLLDLIWELSRDWGLDVAILHVNHRLRGKESEGDQKFVESLAKKYGSPAFIARVETKKEAARKKRSLQEAARDLRYAFFLTKKKELEADVVVTAHNADDNAETMLLNFFRGTGIDGLAGIPVRRSDGSIVRPLLFAPRKEIAEYARKRKLKFREDSSNLSDKYSRNFLRRKLIPMVEDRINPALKPLLLNAAAVLRMTADYLHEQVLNVWKTAVTEIDGEVVFLKDRLREQHPYLRRMLVHEAFLRKGIEPSTDKIEAAALLFDNEAGTRIDCGGGWRVENESDRIRLSHKAITEDFSFVLKKEGIVEGGFFSLSVKRSKNLPNKWGGNSSTEYVDAGKVRFPLYVRSWKEGDSFVPLGMKHPKKVSDLFVDLKIPRTEKRKIPVVESEGNIVWVAGCRIDDRFKITPSSTEAYKLSIRTT
jgi:tRNA(Ile)-lysidine synthase